MKHISKILVLFLINSSIVFATNLTRSGDTVSDSFTKLQWQDDRQIKSFKKNWDYATQYCKNLVLDGHTNWRLPRKNELLSLIDYTKSDPAIKGNIFVNVTSNYYWSSTPNATLVTYAWYISFDTGLVGYNKKEHMEYVRCVRTIK